jgi:hypothetical protein
MSRNAVGGKCFADDEDVEMEVQKWLREQSNDFYAAGFDVLLKRWDKCINFGGGYVEKYMFVSRFEYHMFYVLYPFVTHFTGFPSYNNSLASECCGTMCNIQSHKDVESAG